MVVLQLCWFVNSVTLLFKFVFIHFASMLHESKGSGKTGPIIQTGDGENVQTGLYNLSLIHRKPVCLQVEVFKSQSTKDGQKNKRSYTKLTKKGVKMIWQQRITANLNKKQMTTLQVI